MHGQLVPRRAIIDKWEYWILQNTITDRWTSKKKKEELDNFNSALNNAGDKGWEMIGYEAVPMTSGEKIKGYTYLAFFKRPKK